MCFFFVFFGVCKCSHPFTTITQTSQASGSGPKPIRPDDKRCLYSDGYFQTDKLAVKFDLCSTISGVRDGGAGRPEGPHPPVNLLIYRWVRFLSSLFTASEEEISTGGMRTFVSETLSGVIMNKSQCAEIRQAVCLWAQEEVKVRRRLFKTSAPVISANSGRNVQLSELHLWRWTPAEQFGLLCCGSMAFLPGDNSHCVNSNILTEAYFLSLSKFPSRSLFWLFCSFKFFFFFHTTSVSKDCIKASRLNHPQWQKLKKKKKKCANRWNVSPLTSCCYI